MTRIVTSLAVVVMLAGGCDMVEMMEPYQADRAVDAWAVTSANDQAVKNALVRQSAIFPYHFVTHGAQLNDLGASDLATLIAHFRSNPGRLSIRRGAESQDLYDARVAEVRATLAAGGVDMGRISIADSPGGGDGMPSDNVIVIMGLATPLSVDTGTF